MGDRPPILLHFTRLVKRLLRNVQGCRGTSRTLTAHQCERSLKLQAHQRMGLWTLPRPDARAYTGVRIEEVKAKCTSVWE